MQHTGRRNRKLLAIALLLNVVAFGWYGFLFAKVKAKNERISALHNKIEAEAAEESFLTSVKTLVNDTVALREKIQGFTVAAEGAVPFIELLESTGRAVGVAVSIESVNPVALANAPAAVETLRMQVTGVGAWAGVVRFLGLLELLPFEASVEQAVVSIGERDAWRLDATITVLKNL